jgi:sugar O-acyltransferase (sialic acid O-acetyltransferase NeuD family)
VPKNLVIVGGGEHAQVVAEAAQSRPDLWTLKGFVDCDPSARIRNLPQLRHLGSDDALGQLPQGEEWWAVLGIGGLTRPSARRQVVNSLIGCDIHWASISHAAAYVSPAATVQEGSVIMAGAIVNPNAMLGEHCVVNTGAIVEHDVRIGNFALVSPGVVIGGGAMVEDDCLIGLGAKIRDHVRIGHGATVGMGAVVVKDVQPGAIVTGIPAR